MANQPKKYKKFVATAATATLVASAIVPVASAASFSDVSDSNEFAKFIDALTDEGIINGYPSTNTFKPGALLTRGQVVKMLGRWVENNGVELPSDWKTKAYFKDVPTNHKDQELVKYAALVSKAGVFTGAAGNLMAEKNITRQQMAKVLNGAYAAVNGQSLIEIAEDVDNVRIPDLLNASAEYEAAIQALMDLEISSTTSGNFRPLENVTRGQFSKFLYNTINFKAVDTAKVKAINNTTVEVTFDEAIDDVKDLNFKIEGLEVKNAVVKQSDAKTAVLTTDAQKAGTEYTVSVNGDVVGKFTGVSAVLPESVSFTQRSLQGVYGQQVTVTAQVTVKEGDSKAGIPVTFNIDSNADNATGSFSKDYVAEAVTNENGVATYSYTQYNTKNTEDLVTVYATGKANVRETAEVYWADEARLTVKDITEGNTIANSNTKVYQVTSDENANGWVAVAFKENLSVTPDKVTNGIYFTDAVVYNVASNGDLTLSVANNKGVPFEVTTGGHQVALVKLNSDGVGNFTLTGADASVTPVVYDFEGEVTTVGSTPTKATSTKYSATDLQATASAVKFEANQTAQIKLEATGVQAAASRTATGDGGREYTVTLKDKDGKIAPEGQPVYIYFDKKSSGNSNSNTSAALSLTQIVDGKETTTSSVTPASSNNLNDAVRLTVDNKGQVKFVVRGALNDYATPIAVYDNGKSTETGKIDSSDAQATGEIVYFGTAKVGASKAKITSVATGKEVTSITGNDTAKIEYTAVDQNGFPYYNSTTANFDATFTFTEAFANYTVSGATLVSSENNRKTYKATASNGKVELYVTSSKGTVYFNASTTNNVLAPQSGSIAFNTLADAATLTGTVTYVDTINNKVTLNVNGQSVEVSYADALLFYKGSQAGVNEAYFEGKLLANATVAYNKATDSTKAKFDILADPPAAADVPVTVTGSKAIDSNGDGDADQIEITFSKDVDPSKFAIADFTVTKGATTGGSIAAGSTPNKLVVTLGTKATGGSVGTLTIAPVTDAGVDLSDFAGITISPATAVVPTLVAATATTTAGTGTEQVETLTVGAATNTGDAIISVKAAGFNGGQPLNITLPVTLGETATDIGAKVLAKLQANTTVTNFFDVTAGATADEVVLTAKQAKADDTSMALSLAGGANNVVAGVVSADTTPGAVTAETVAIAVTAGATNAGTVKATVTDGTFSKSVSISVTASETDAQVASKLFAALYNDTTINARYNVTISGTTVTLTNKTAGTTPATVVTVQ